MSAGPHIADDADFSGDGQRVVEVNRDGIAVYDARSGERVAFLAAQNAIRVRFSPDGTLIAIGTYDGGVEIWDGKRSDVQSTLVGPPHAAWLGLGWSGDGKIVVSATSRGDVNGWNVATGQPLFAVHTGAKIYALFVHHGRDGFSTIGEDAQIRTWDMSGTPGASERDDDHPVGGAMSPRGDRIAYAVGDHRGKIVDSATGKELVSLTGHVAELYDASWSPDGHFVVTASADGTARLWDASLGSMLAVFSQSGRVYRAAFSPDGRHILMAGTGGTTVRDLPRLHDPEEWRRIVKCLPFRWNADHVEPDLAAKPGCRD